MHYFVGVPGFHRRRIYTEAKAKVVAALFGGTELIRFLAALQI